MFTVEDYNIVQKNSDLMSSHNAIRKLAQHIKAGSPKPDGIPQDWWDKRDAVISQFFPFGMPEDQAIDLSAYE